MPKNSKVQRLREIFPLSTQDTVVFIVCMFCATLVCSFMRGQAMVDGSYALIFVLAVLIISRLTSGYFYGLAASIVSVFAVNYVFTYPFLAFNFTLTGYPVTFLSMLAVSLITSALTSQVKHQEQIRIEIEKEKMRATLLRAISHDLRTPLTSIIGSTSVVLENEDSLSPEKKRELLSEVIAESQWLIQMVENLLSITKINSEGAKVHKREEIVEEILSETVTNFRSRYPAATIHVSVPDEVLIVPMDAILIEQVLFNLLENAIIHGKTVTSIELSVTLENQFAKFSIADNGKGIADEVFPHLFEDTGWYEDESRSDGKRNMGIGLSVCYSIVRAHGGEIHAVNNPSGGATFYFLLPLEEDNVK